MGKLNKRGKRAELENPKIIEPKTSPNSEFTLVIKNSDKKALSTPIELSTIIFVVFFPSISTNANRKNVIDIQYREL